MPQDINFVSGGEEIKHEISSEQKLINWIRQLLCAIQKKTNEK